MTTPVSRRSSSMSDDLDGYDSPSSKENDKSIPFLRRLVDMITENQDFISFHPGSKKNGKVVLARIEVHNRAQVEQNILPRYFNHNSFASLRRQLNYFSFTRLGKGRQKGAAYCNEGVIVMDDILKLKRRLHTTTSSAAVTSSGPPSEVAPSEPTGCSSNSGATMSLSTPEPSISGKKHPRSVSISSDESFNSNSDTTDMELVLSPLKKKPRRLLSTMAPLYHLEQDNDSSSSLTVGVTARYKNNRSTTVVLDLTRPTTATEQLYRGRKQPWTVPPTTGTRTRHLPISSSSSGDEEDVLAGCQALLSFSRGPSPGGLVV